MSEELGLSIEERLHIAMARLPVFQMLHCQTSILAPVYVRKMKVHFKKGYLDTHLPREYLIQMEWLEVSALVSR